MNTALPPAIATRHEAVAALCRSLGVRSLELFGSAATGRFTEGTSDVDFIVTFKDGQAKGIARVYLRLADGLERLLGGAVDLLTPEAIRNPYFRQSVDATRRLIYEDRDEKTAG